ncbi:MAG: hypothetical protein ACYTGN_02350 [Planctomycetota bacterium]|jgi:hypothetical protein
MMRQWMVIAAVVAGLAVIVMLLFPSDRKEVEALVHHLKQRAIEGGPDAADEILDTLADDYRGTADRGQIERHVRRYVGEAQVVSIDLGDFKTVWKGDEIVIPLLAVYAEVAGRSPRFLLLVTFARRDDAWKITSISRAKWGR